MQGQVVLTMNYTRDSYDELKLDFDADAVKELPNYFRRCKYDYL